VPTTTYQWEPYRDALKSVTHTTGDATQTWLKVEYGNVGAANSAINDIGQRERATYSGAIYHTVNPAPSPGHSIFAYNANGEVVADQRKDATGTAIAGRSYNYDPIGNRLGSAFDGGGTTTYLPNLLNQYQAVTRGATTTNPLHDLDGNLVNDGSKVYVWDAENRLSEVRRASDNALIASYRYDYMSRRIQKKTTTAAPQGAGETLFHYDGWNLLAEYEVDGTSLEILRTYTWGPDLSGSMQGAGGVGGLLAMDEKDGYSVHHPLYDGNGNILAMIQGTTSIISFVSAIYEYDAFGNTVFMDDGFPEENPFRFSTKYFDKETGFYYYGYRYYDPVTGRWPSRDPIEENGGLNLYGFISNDAISSTDFLGLDQHHWFPQFGQGGAGAGQDLMNDICPCCHINIHRYTTEMSSELHQFVHYKLGYSEGVEWLMASSMSCCDYLKKMSAYILAVHNVISIFDGLIVGDGSYPTGVLPRMRPFGSATGNTRFELMGIIFQCCKNLDTSEIIKDSYIYERILIDKIGSVPARNPSPSPGGSPVGKPVPLVPIRITPGVSPTVPKSPTHIPKIPKQTPRSIRIPIFPILLPPYEIIRGPLGLPRPVEELPYG
jgi:RHS repeat-associated protein